MAAAGGPKPLCVGIESGRRPAGCSPTGSRTWCSASTAARSTTNGSTNEVKFDDPQIVEAMQTVADLWTEENVFAAGGIDLGHELR